uniref:Uncharacterized protein n=1 Tax=viral metagenome TaxID=1070528 RepID=A0A6C0D7J9_9ZZZZ
MTRCSQITAKGLRCKSHGAEHNGKIICATHLKHMMPELIPVVVTFTAPICTHKNNCSTSTENCCECSDMRPIEEHSYKSYNKKFSHEFSIVSRHHYYCVGCKNRLNQQQFDATIAEMKDIVGINDVANCYLSSLKKTHKILVKQFNDVIADSKSSETNWRFLVDDTLDHILSERLAGMPEDESTWTGKDARLNTLMNKLTAIHKAMLKPTQPLNLVNPDRPETLEAAYERIDELQKKIAEMTTQLTASKEKAKGAALMSLWNSGCEDMCYHLGFCSDVMGDCWEPVYEKNGLKGLKANLRAESKHHHNGKDCKDCKNFIDSLHD